MLVELSKDQWRNIVDFIELNLLDVIRQDIDIDNLKWVESMILAKNEIEKELERENT
jgi:hypothetical protein